MGKAKVVYEAIFEYDAGKEELFVKRIGAGGTEDRCAVSLGDVLRLEKACRDFSWNRSDEVSRKTGEELYGLLDGEKGALRRALKEAGDRGERLEVYVRPDGPASNLPFELIYDGRFLASCEVHVVRRVSEWGRKKRPRAKGRALRVLFMACSPEGVSALRFEKEEEAIYEVTKDMAVEIDVEDTGSLEGLGGKLAQNEYDVVHLSGHADIDKEGNPFFWMEDEEGRPEWVGPSGLYDKLRLNVPRLVFLSGCRTGETPGHAAAVSFAQHLVADHSSTVLGWGLPVSDGGASVAAQELYFELSRGESILAATLSARRRLVKAKSKDWSLLRVFSDGTQLGGGLVKKGQKRRAKARELQYICLARSQVKVLQEGFVGRRRQIQQGLRCLRSDRWKVGVVLHGTGGLGKSCLAGRLCERFKDHTLIVVHGKLNVITFGEALKDGFTRGKDEEGLKILGEAMELADKIRGLCSSAFQARNYLILLDDFEQNLEGAAEGRPRVSAGAADILEALVGHLAYSGKMSQVIITSRYTFALERGGADLVEEVLELIGLTSFRGADERKKVSELKEIDTCSDLLVRQHLIDAGHGNPRLMEGLNILLAETGWEDIAALLEAVKDKEAEFVEGLILRRILESQAEGFRAFMRRCAVYRLPVLEGGIELVSEGSKAKEHIERAVRLSLMERDSSRRREAAYWVTPLLREGLLAELADEERARCHGRAAEYYKKRISEAEGYSPIMGIELIEHALNSDREVDALEEAGERLLPSMRISLAYKDAQAYGESILGRISDERRDGKYSGVLVQLGEVCHDLGNAKKAIEYHEQALAIGKEVYGERHPSVAAMLNNLGAAWRTLGDAKKAIEYYEQALAIGKEVYGERHPSVAITLNNLGSAWSDLGDAKKAIKYYEQALAIGKEIYGERHPTVATMLNNLGTAWRALGVAKKAIEYHEQALAIDKEVYGERHPATATDLNNLGIAWSDLGDAKKAIEYFEQALAISKEVYGERHPSVATRLNNLGEAWRALGDAKKAIEYFEQALAIGKEVYGERHPSVATRLNNLGLAWSNLGDAKKAIEYYEQALAIVREVYGERHPYVASTLNNLGAAWRDLGEAGKAIEYIEQAYAVFREVYGEEHPSTKTVKANLDGLRGEGIRN